MIERYYQPAPPQPIEIVERHHAGPTTPKKTITNDQGDLKLIVVLYELMRDHIPTGVLHEIVDNAQTTKSGEALHTCDFSNGWLAAYAQELAARLVDA